jgi:hypothetical protein
MRDAVLAHMSIVPEESALRCKFFETIMQLQNFAFPVNGHHPVLTFDNVAIFDYLRHCGAFSESCPGTIKPLSQADRRNAATNFYRGLTLLGNRAPGMAACSSLVVGNLVICDGADCDVKSGSLYSNVGLVYLCLDGEWSPLTFAEHFLHESVHNALFIEDMVRGVFEHGEACSSSAAKVISSIRRQTRNYDLSFHAACVSVLRGVEN